MPGSGPLRILHLDDDPVNLLVMDQMLACLGHRPTGAASGAAALDQLAKDRFDVVLTDVHMPQMDGLAFLETLRAGPRRDIPVIAITADVMSRPGAAYQTLGFAGAIAKPILAETLEKVLANAVCAPEQRRFVFAGLAKR